MPVPITLYESRWCGYSRAARRLLEQRGWTFDGILVDGNPAARTEMEQRSGRHTVPQIFFGDTHIGGFDDMAALEADGELEALYQGLPDGGAATGQDT